MGTRIEPAKRTRGADVARAAGVSKTAVSFAFDTMSLLVRGSTRPLT